MLADIVESITVALTAVRANVGGNPVAIKPIKKFRDGDLVWINRGAALQLRNQARTFNLRLTLRSLETVPAALALAGHRIVVIDHDCPMARAALANMASHDLFSLLGSTAYPGLIACEASRDRVQVSDHPIENLLISKTPLSHRRYPEDRTQTFEHGNQLRCRRRHVHRDVRLLISVKGRPEMLDQEHNLLTYGAGRYQIIEPPLIGFTLNPSNQQRNHARQQMHMLLRLLMKPDPMLQALPHSI